MILFFLARDGHDSRLSEGGNLAKANHETATIHFRHKQIDEHQIGSKCVRYVECLRPAIGHMHLVAEFFNEQTQGVSAVAVVINHENTQNLPARRHACFLSPARARSCPES